MDFSFYVTFSRDTGLRLFDIKYRGERIDEATLAWRHRRYEARDVSYAFDRASGVTRDRTDEGGPDDERGSDWQSRRRRRGRQCGHVIVRWQRAVHRGPVLAVKKDPCATALHACLHVLLDYAHSTF